MQTAEARYFENAELLECRIGFPMPAYFTPEMENKLVPHTAIEFTP